MGSLQCTEKNLLLFNSQSWSLILLKEQVRYLTLFVFTYDIEERYYVLASRLSTSSSTLPKSTLNLHHLHVHDGPLIPVSYVPKNKLEFRSSSP